MKPPAKTKITKIFLLGVLFFCLFSNLALAANSRPQLGTIIPSSGSSEPDNEVIFTTTYIDKNGWTNLYQVRLLMNTYINGANCFYGYYDQNTNRLYVRNSANTAWLGGYAPGTSNVIENSHIKLNCAKTTVSGSGTTLTVKWAITFKTPLSGKTHNSYMYAVDDSHSVATWAKKGTWLVNAKPQLGAIDPSSGSSEPNREVTFTTTYTDADGWKNLSVAQLLINTSANGPKCFYGYYKQGTNKFYLRNDANTAWLGGFSPGSNRTIENSYVKLNCAKTSIGGSGNVLTIKWAVTFKAPFSGKTYNSYLYASDDFAAVAWWTQKGTWTVGTPSANYWIMLDEHDTPLPAAGGNGWYFNASGGDRGKLHEEDISYTWNNDSVYTATVVHKNPGAAWTYGGMWYSPVRVNNDNKPLNFKKIFGRYIKDQFQGKITNLEITVNSVSSPSSNSSLVLRVQLKDVNGNIIFQQPVANLTSQIYPKTFTINVDTPQVQEIEEILWVMDYAQMGDSISVDKIRLYAQVPIVPAEEQAFYWTYSWLMNNYNPDTGMVKDKSRDGPSPVGGDSMESVTATGKLAKITYFAYKKGYVTYENAVAVITKIVNTLINVVPKGPAGINTLWPHFTENGGTVPVPPRDFNGIHYEGSEWASGDTAYAALDVVTALQLIADPLGQLPALENFLKGINWAGLLTSQGYISHGYKYDGTKIAYDWRGFGMETMGVNWAYASSTGQVTDMGPAPSDNGSGFIDNAQYPMVFSGLDGWGNDWDTYRNNMASTQAFWYRDHPNNYLWTAALFGLSAGENPQRAFNAQPDYAAYGIGGRTVPANDGNSEVFLLHYSGMIADLMPAEATHIWETLRDSSATFLQGKIILSPLNNMESMKVDKTNGRVTVNYLKGSWNLALQAEGWALMNPALRNELRAAIEANAFLKQGYDILKNPIVVTPTIRVPQDYPTIQAAIDAAQSGYRILVSVGTYNESIVLNKSGILLMGDAGKSIIKSVGETAVYCQNISGEETIISGFKITGAQRGITCAGSVNSLRIENNILEYNTTEQSGIGIYLESGASSKIIHNSIYQSARGIQSAGDNNVEIVANSISRCRGSYGGGIVLYDTQGLIKDNSISNCWDGAIELYSGCNVQILNNKMSTNTSWDMPAGVNINSSTAVFSNNVIYYGHVYHYAPTAGLYAASSNVSMINNVFYANSGQSTSSNGVAANIINSNIVAKNNIFYANTNGMETIYRDGTGTQDFSYNDLYDTTTRETTGVTLGQGALNVDPLFVDAVDFRLKPASPCINAGDPSSQFNDSDGTRNDMGIWGGPNSSE